MELKSGSTYNGTLVSIDSWMNLNLSSCIFTSADGSEFYEVGEVYLRGSGVKFFRVGEEVGER